MRVWKKHAKDLAARHRVMKKSGFSYRFTPRIEEDRKILVQAYKAINEAIKSNEPMVPASEWLLDNFYIIEEQLKEIQHGIPKSYFRELPVLIDGPYKGCPRAYWLAMEMVAHTDGRIDESVLKRFIQSFQSETSLSSNELWSIPFMLRIALIKNIKWIAVGIVDAQNQRKSADLWAAKLMEKEKASKEELEKALEDLGKSTELMGTAFIERLLQRLREEGAEASLILRWLDEKLLSLDLAVESVIQSEHQGQAAKQVSIGNSITSLRLLSTLTWLYTFEELSQVEQILRIDPGKVYPQMDFASRNYYRRQVEKLAKEMGISEVQVARKALECAQEAMEKDAYDARANHVGYYLVGNGRRHLKQKVGYEPSGVRKWYRYLMENPTVFFLGSIGLITAALEGALIYYGYRVVPEFSVFLLPMLVVAFIPSLSISTSIVNWIVSHTFSPCFLAKLELKDEIPDECKTMVVIPTLLSNEKRAEELVEQMEVFYLANQGENLHFALLGDFPDANEQEKEMDDRIIKKALDGIRQLNKRYGDGKEDLFYYFHRKRQWNYSQGKWMGWERKRGALMELNRFLRGAQDTSFMVTYGDLTVLPAIKYVITLDADTQLPRDAAKRLVGTIAHPLNRPVMDMVAGKVVEGYGILQPRMGITVTSASRSRFSLIFSGQTGMDPYTMAVSDVYQDLFCEGIFTGKGIYDVDAFLSVLDNRIPDNTILSHDLLEGCYARAGLVTDIELIDGYPSNYNAFSARLHRWVRGDWQLLPWMKKKCREANGELKANPLSIIAKWKISDNLRRSLLSPTLMLLIFFGLLFPTGSMWIGPAVALLTLAFPLLLDLAGGIISQGFTFSGRVLEIVTGTRNGFYQTIFSFIFLPHQAVLMMDAVLRTIIRMFFTHKNLIEWVTAADAEKKFKGDLKSFWAKMWASPLLAVIFLTIGIRKHPEFWPLIGLLFLAWFFAPSIAYWLSKPCNKRMPSLSKEQVGKLRLLARKTWRYFEEFCNEEENWLPPDNYQEDPRKGLAHRTSPTNIGLGIATNLAARDLGYIGLIEMLGRVDHMIKSIEKLEKWNGHLYNWYDTKTLSPLRPLYVSSVDNGNLICYLITSKQGLQEMVRKPLVDVSMLEGIRDTLILMHEEGEDKDSAHFSVKMQAQLEKVEQSCEDFFEGGKNSLVEWQGLLRQLKDYIEHAKNGEKNLGGSWRERLLNMLIRFEEEMNELTPWVDIWNRVPESLESGSGAFQEVSEKLHAFILELQAKSSLVGLVDGYNDILDNLSDIMASLLNMDERNPAYDEAVAWLHEFELSLARSHMAAKKRLSQAMDIYKRIDQIIENTDFALLYDEKRELFSIGYDKEEERLSNSYYDLLASEARQTSFVAIAKGDIPQKHWFRLGRSLTLVGDRRVLLSWSGTMFEYLMPLLIMRNYEYTLLDETYSSIIIAQKQYGDQRHIPWGVSESGYYAFDLQSSYQYKAFGIPKVGLKRGLVKDVVVSPYSTMLALPVAPYEAYQNIEALLAEGMGGQYGMYEAIDYTVERLPRRKKSMIVKSYMSHHQSMSLLALDNFLNGNVMQERFHRVPIIKATELLLQERIPKQHVIMKEYEEEIPETESVKFQTSRSVRSISDPNTIHPETHLLSNGSYTVMITNSGAGYSMNQGIEINRWREDPTRDSWGMFFYIHNLNSNEVWSATYQPMGIMPDEYTVTFEPDHVTFIRRDGSIETKTEVTVSPEHNAEVRRITLVNHGEYSRVLDVTSYFELVLAPMVDDIAHPAFSNLFVETQFIPEYNALLATRRARTKEQKPVWLMHTLLTEGQGIGQVQYETDRLKFIGRGRSASCPVVIEPEYPLSDTSGAVLDPVMSLRKRVRVNPGESAQLYFVVAMAKSRQEAVELAKEYQGTAVAARVFELAWTHSQVELRYLNIKASQANLYQYMASQILYMSPARRQIHQNIEENRKGQSALWAYGISGDQPIVLVRVSNLDHIPMVRQVLSAHEYWRLKGLWVDLVILNEYGNSYEQPLQDWLMELISISHARDLQDRPGGVFLRQAANIPREDQVLLQVAARFILTGNGGSLLEQVKLKSSEMNLPPLLEVRTKTAKIQESETAVGDHQLHFYNDIGGFSEDGKEYVIKLKPQSNTPMPWSNIVANRRFGFLITESGAGYTWSENSRENKITRWSNDAVTDPPGEILYLRDDESGKYWTITPAPLRQNIEYTIRHGQGYTVFEQASQGLMQSLTLFVALDSPVKFFHTELRNISGRTRQLSLTLYVEFVLGVQREKNAPFIVTRIDDETGALLATNAYNEEFPRKLSFLYPLGCSFTFTGDRREFIGRNRSVVNPAAMERQYLSGNIGAGYDPCGAVQVKTTLEAGEVRKLTFLMGEVDNREELKNVLRQFPTTREVEEELKKTKAFWDQSLSIVQVKTPDLSMDLMLNRWFLYQTWACRLWARTGFYQDGGAYGFRDQLQDVMALVYNRPDLTREQIMRSAAHQFLEGDVQHWWHPPRCGVRTHITDDLLFLPYVTADYVEITGDTSILEEMVPYLESAPLQPEEEDRYETPRISPQRGTVYEHCIRAIERALRFGEHGIPLMGTGDWNDGMNSVGDEGKGESIWLGWFLYTTLCRFIPICRNQKDRERAERYTMEADRLLEAIERHGWDGGWYRRAYFDDGTPLGSEENPECRIDLIAQSWAVISGGGKPSRIEEAMKAVENYLVDREMGIIKLLTPPFDKSELEPGYIKGYVPGVRENGGQYSHGAVWTVLAFAKMGKGDKAWELFHLLNPINHCRTWIEASIYKVEPYVMAADVYAVHPHRGRGGWTWYTGSAGWMYRVGIEWIIGLRIRGNVFTIDPCIPRDWSGYEIQYRYKKTQYVIQVENPARVNRGVEKLFLDGVLMENMEIPFLDDKQIHLVRVILGGHH
ncbi:MAG: GH36-type glycosyl hydrolase domain-containing protein [Clostridia bacterium]